MGWQPLPPEIVAELEREQEKILRELSTELWHTVDRVWTRQEMKRGKKLPPHVLGQPTEN